MATEEEKKWFRDLGIEYAAFTKLGDFFIANYEIIEGFASECDDRSKFGWGLFEIREMDSLLYIFRDLDRFKIPVNKCMHRITFGA